LVARFVAGARGVDPVRPVLLASLHGLAVGAGGLFRRAHRDRVFGSNARSERRAVRIVVVRIAVAAGARLAGDRDPGLAVVRARARNLRRGALRLAGLAPSHAAGLTILVRAANLTFVAAEREPGRTVRRAHHAGLFAQAFYGARRADLDLRAVAVPAPDEKRSHHPEDCHA